MKIKDEKVKENIKTKQIDQKNKQEIKNIKKETKFENNIKKVEKARKEKIEKIEKTFIKEITQKEYESKFPNKFIIEFERAILIPVYASLYLIFKIPIPNSKIFGKINEKNILEELEVDENF